MGCWQSVADRDEMVSLCKARRGYMKQVVKGRQDFASAHILYLRSVRDMGSALLRLADAEAHLLPLLHSPPPSPLSVATRQPASRARMPTSQSPPPRVQLTPPSVCPSISSTNRPPEWGLRVPFTTSARLMAGEDEEGAVFPVPEMAVASSDAETSSSWFTVISPVSKDPTGDLTMAISMKRKDLAEIVQELEELFHKEADAGDLVTMLLEPQECHVSSGWRLKGRACRYEKSLRPLLRHLGQDARSKGHAKPKVEGAAASGAISHGSTVEKLYAWEKKLYAEVKNEEGFREKRGKKVSQVRRQEVKGVDNSKVHKNRKEIERLESKMAVASQAMGTLCTEITQLRETELYPLLLELLNGLKVMWKSMYEYSHVQTHTAQQLEYLTVATKASPAASATLYSLHGDDSHELEIAVQRWHAALRAMMDSQREYISALAGWLRLPLFQFYGGRQPRTQLDTVIYALCEEWQLALDKIPEKEALDAIQSLLAAAHAIVLQREEEGRQRRTWESAVSQRERKTAELAALESGCSHRSAPEDREPTVDRLMAKRSKLDGLRVRAEEEKAKYEKSAIITRETTLSGLQRELPNVFQAMMAFSGACMEAFEAVHGNHCRDLDRAKSLKMLLPG